MFTGYWCGVEAGGVMQQVNLYLEEFRSKEPEFSAAMILILCGYLVFIGSVIGIGLYGLVIHEMDENIALENQANFWDEQLNIAFRQNPEPKIDERLIVAITGYENRIRRNKNVLNYLNGQQKDFKRQSFSIYLLGLTWVKQDDLWLTEVAIKQGGESLTLTGRALNPDALPEYLKKLSEIDVFKNLEFEVFDLKRDGNEVQFIVSSEKEDGSLEGFLENATSQN